MSEAEVPAQPPASRPKRRILFRLFRGFLVFVVLIIVTYIVADQVMLRKVQQKREAFKERFGAVDFRDFIPERPAPEDDAGRVYLYAAGLMAQVNAEHGDWSAFDALTKGPEAFRQRGQQDAELPSPDEIDARVRVKLAAMEEAFTFVAQARGMARGSFLESYEPVDIPPVLEEVRMLSRNLAAKAIFEAREGNLEAAAVWLESGLHLAAVLNQEPTLIVQMIRISLVELAISTAEEVFNSASVAVPLSARYFVLLDSTAGAGHFANGLVSEAALTMSYPVQGPRPFWSFNLNKILEVTGRIADAVQRPASPERLGELELIEEDTARLSALHVVARMMVPNLLRSAREYDHMMTRCELVQIAAQLGAWKVQNGTYPESLDLLISGSPEPLPIDPFAGEPYRYRREGEGFVLYSVGPDRKDDGGAKVEERKGGGDIVWTCVR